MRPTAAAPATSIAASAHCGLCGVYNTRPPPRQLYCEKISLGGDEVREIASGLQGHFTLEQMRGQRVVIVKNLKSRKLAGFASNGMVLCATGEDGRVEFVEPPAGAALGERVAFAGHEGAAAEPSRVDKKKVRVRGVARKGRVATLRAHCSHAFAPAALRGGRARLEARGRRGDVGGHCFHDLSGPVHSALVARGTCQVVVAI